MKVGLIPSDVGACCFYRLAWPGQAVMDEMGWEVRLFHPQSVRVAAMPEGGVAIHGIEDIESFDLFVIQRLPSPLQVEFIKAVQSVGVAVVVDVDDALWRIDPDNASHERWNERVGYGSLRRFEILDAAAHLADLVTVSTPLLQRRYGGEDKAWVVRNGLPNAAFTPNVKTGFQNYLVPWEGPITLGWSGSLDSHPHDLQVMGDAVQRIFAEYDDVRFHVVGDAKPIADVLRIPRSRVTGTGWLPLDQYHEALREIDLMLVPLAATAFNNAKSALKAQEGSAAGCLVLGSATPEITRLYHLGGFQGGIVSQTGADENLLWWSSMKNALSCIRSGAWYGHTQERARFLEFSQRARDWADAWTAAVNNRKEARRVAMA